MEETRDKKMLHQPITVFICTLNQFYVDIPFIRQNIYQINLDSCCDCTWYPSLIEPDFSVFTKPNPFKPNQIYSKVIVVSQILI